MKRKSAGCRHAVCLRHLQNGGRDVKQARLLISQRKFFNALAVALRRATIIYIHTDSVDTSTPHGTLPIFQGLAASRHSDMNAPHLPPKEAQDLLISLPAGHVHMH